MLPSGTDGLPRGYSVLGSQVGTSSGWFQSYMYITCILYVYNIICTHIIMWKIMLCINSEDQRMSSALSWPSEKFVRSSVAFATKHGCPRNGDRNVVKIRWETANETSEHTPAGFVMLVLFAAPLRSTLIQRTFGSSALPAMQRAWQARKSRNSGVSLWKWEEAGSRSHSKVLKTFLKLKTNSIQFLKHMFAVGGIIRATYFRTPTWKIQRYCAPDAVARFARCSPKDIGEAFARCAARTGGRIHFAMSRMWPSSYLH